jgi:hypothetical protein
MLRRAPEGLQRLVELRRHEHPTIGDLAAYIDRHTAPGAPPPGGPGEDEEDISL